MLRLSDGLSSSIKARALLSAYIRYAHSQWHNNGYSLSSSFLVTATAKGPFSVTRVCVLHFCVCSWEEFVGWNSVSFVCGSGNPSSWWLALPVLSTVCTGVHTHTHTHTNGAEYKGRKKEVSFLDSLPCPSKIHSFPPSADWAFLSLSSFLFSLQCLYPQSSPLTPQPCTRSPFPFLLSHAHSSVISLCFSTVHHYLSLSSPCHPSP